MTHKLARGSIFLSFCMALMLPKHANATAINVSSIVVSSAATNTIAPAINSAVEAAITFDPSEYFSQGGTSDSVEFDAGSNNSSGIILDTDVQEYGSYNNPFPSIVLSITGALQSIEFQFSSNIGSDYYYDSFSADVTIEGNNLFSDVQSLDSISALSAWSVADVSGNFNETDIYSFGDGSGGTYDQTSFQFQESFAVSEPSCTLLVTLGAVGLAGYRRRWWC